jgi:DNA repair exonuclease SbcCD ATPase subunit
MDTSLISKPAFGTSGFAVSPVDSSEYIDAAAEETCPAETIPMLEQPAVHEVTEAVSAASLEVMDQLKALAQNVTQGNSASSLQDDASDQSVESEDTGANDPGESQAPEPSISVLPRPTGFENNPAINDRPKFGTRVLTLAGFVVAALIGVGGTFAWQDHLKSDDVATAAAPAPVVAAPVIPPYLGRQLEELSQDISSMRRRMEELTAEQKRLAALQQQFEQLAVKQQTLAAKQDQAGQSIVKLQTLEQARQRTPAPVQSRPVPVPPPPVQSTMPPPPPQTAAHPVPPLPVPQR